VSFNAGLAAGWLLRLKKAMIRYST
jgi:hypothetical protein